MTALPRRTERALDELARQGATASELFREAMRQLSSQLPCDGWCGLTLDPATLVMTGGVHEHGLTPDAIRRLLEIEYGEGDANLFVDLARARSPASGLAARLADGLTDSPRFRDVLVPSGYGDELRVVLRAGGVTWGALVLFRIRGAAAFTPEEAAVAEAVSEPLAGALRAALLAACVSVLDTFADRALLVLSADGTIESATPEARRLLDELAEDGPPDSARVPQSIQALAHDARRGSDRPSRVRARTRSDAWVTIHASALDPDGGRVAVFIDPSGPLEIASLILQAYGLTRREGELVRLVLHGLDTEQIAEALGISAYTVQDHLKSVFDKVGVNSRKELVARIFFTHYLPRISSQLGPDGWFTEPRRR